MAFEFFCATLIALLLGLAIAFGGYRLFMGLLPIWGFFFGFGLGAQTLNFLLGYGFFASVTSWVVGFIVGSIFAVLSYMFYFIGVAVLAGSVGYGLGVSLMLWIGLPPGIITWLVGLVLGIALVFVTLRFNLQKYMVAIGTSLVGAGLLVGTLLLGIGGVSLLKFLENPIRTMLQNTPLWAILYLAIAVGGVIVQLRAHPIPEFDELTTIRL